MECGHCNVFGLFLVSVMVLFWVDYAFLERFWTIFLGDKYSTNNYRIEVWLKSLEIIEENWILGIGIGNDVFRKVYALYMKPGFEALSPYSIYFQVLIESGILGLFLFLTIIKKSIRVLLRVIKVSPIICLTIMLSLTGLLFQGLFDTVFFRLPVYSIFWFMVAALVSLAVYEETLVPLGNKILVQKEDGQAK